MKQRIDQWLFYARAFKSRSLAGKECNGGKVRLDGVRIKKASQLVEVRQEIAFRKGRQNFIYKILGLGKRRGPAPEAQLLYEDLSPVPDKTVTTKSGVKITSQTIPPAQRERGTGRPTKRERRLTDKFRGEG